MRLYINKFLKVKMINTKGEFSTTYNMYKINNVHLCGNIQTNVFVSAELNS